jgi:isocitrate dehydrogenase
VSLEMLADKTDNPRARLLGEALDRATGSVLENGRSPSRKVGELDNRGSHFYLTLYWAQELAAQSADRALAELLAAVADQLSAYQDQIAEEMLLEQGKPVDIGGYYRPDPALVCAVMRPSATFNTALAVLPAEAAP